MWWNTTNTIVVYLYGNFIYDSLFLFYWYDSGSIIVLYMCPVDDATNDV